VGVSEATNSLFYLIDEIYSNSHIVTISKRISSNPPNFQKLSQQIMNGHIPVFSAYLADINRDLNKVIDGLNVQVAEKDEDIDVLTEYIDGRNDYIAELDERERTNLARIAELEQDVLIDAFVLSKNLQPTDSYTADELSLICIGVCMMFVWLLW